MRLDGEPDMGRMLVESISWQELFGFEEPTIVRQEHAVLGGLFGGNAAGDFSPENGDTLAVMGVSFPNEGIGAEDGGKEISFGMTALEKRVDFEPFEREDDEVIEADGLANEHPHVDGTEFADGEVAQVIS